MYTGCVNIAATRTKTLIARKPLEIFDRFQRESLREYHSYLSDIKTFRSSEGSSSCLIMDEIRKRVVARIEAGEGATAISKALGIHRVTVYKIKKLYEDTGGFKQRQNGGRPKGARTEAKIDEVKADIEANPSTSIRKLSRDHSRWPDSRPA